MRDIKFRAWHKREHRMRTVVGLKFDMNEVLLGDDFFDDKVCKESAGRISAFRSLLRSLLILQSPLKSENEIGRPPKIGSCQNV